MSICTFLASDHPLPQVTPPLDYPVSINIDTGEIFDGAADDNFFLHPFEDTQCYTHKKYGVWLEWHYTNGRAQQLLQYIKDALQNTDTVELWHVWLMDYFYEYEESPIIHSRSCSVRELTTEDIKEIDRAEIWNTPDRRHPNRPSFYRITVFR